MSVSRQKIAVLGATRGLGRALVGLIQSENPEIEMLLIARGDGDLQKRSHDVRLLADFTKPADQARVRAALYEFQSSTIYYVAGGGPFGEFEKKEWKDHQWALDLNFNFPARLVHDVLAEPAWATFLKQFVWIGSKIAGQNADPRAASYAAAKHAARGLVSSLQQEGAKKIDIALYEPGYMATDLLPANAWPRQQGLARAAEDEARELWHWSQNRLR